MKLKTTKKEIKKNSNNIIAVSYCGLQSLLNYKNPFAYSSGNCGWSCDYYDIDGVIISTGYSPIGEYANYDLVREYEEKAKVVVYDWELKYDAKVEQLDKLLSEFINKAKPLKF